MNDVLSTFRTYRKFCTCITAILIAAIISAASPVLASNSSAFPDGSYSIAVDLDGGTGRATVQSPCEVTITDGQATARIEWSSPNYDYMLVEDQKYLTVNTEGNSVFEIPITVWDSPMDVIADTLAMSTPHEIEYQLTFHSDAIPTTNHRRISPVLMGLAIAALLMIGAAVYYLRRRKTS